MDCYIQKYPNLAPTFYQIFEKRWSAGQNVWNSFKTDYYPFIFEDEQYYMQIAVYPDRYQPFNINDSVVKVHQDIDFEVLGMFRLKSCYTTTIDILTNGTNTQDGVNKNNFTSHEFTIDPDANEEDVHAMLIHLMMTVPDDVRRG